jgi:hypothetical protein
LFIQEAAVVSKKKGSAKRTGGAVGEKGGFWLTNKLILTTKKAVCFKIKAVSLTIKAVSLREKAVSLTRTAFLALEKQFL